MTTTKKTLDEIAAEPLSKERLQELQAIADEDIDTSDIPELDDEFWKNAKVRLSANKEALSLRVDRDVVDWFRDQGRGYQTKMNIPAEFLEMDNSKFTNRSANSILLY